MTILAIVTDIVPRGSLQEAVMHLPFNRLICSTVECADDYGPPSITNCTRICHRYILFCQSILLAALYIVQDSVTNILDRWRG